MVNFFLRIAIDHDGNRFIEFEFRTAVQGSKVHLIQSEISGHSRPFLFSVIFKALFTKPADLPYFGIPENGSVIIGSFFGLIIEPKANVSLFADS